MMKQLLSVATFLLLVGCTQTPSIQQGPDAEMTFDGLVRIDDSRFTNGADHTIHIDGE